MSGRESRSRPPSARSPPPCSGTCGCWPAGCPARASPTVRTLAGWFELAGIDEVVRELSGLDAAPGYTVGDVGDRPVGARAGQVAPRAAEPPGPHALGRPRRRRRVGDSARPAARLGRASRPRRPGRRGVGRRRRGLARGPRDRSRRSTPPGAQPSQGGRPPHPRRHPGRTTCAPSQPRCPSPRGGPSRACSGRTTCGEPSPGSGPTSRTRPSGSPARRDSGRPRSWARSRCSPSTPGGSGSRSPWRGPRPRRSCSMPSSERLRPVAMQRVAIMTPAADQRAVLVAVADSGTVELDHDQPMGEAAEASRRLQRLRGVGGAAGPPALLAAEPDLDALEAGGRMDLLAGESQLQDRAASAVRRGAVAGFTGWMPRAAVPEPRDPAGSARRRRRPTAAPARGPAATLLSPSRPGRAAAPLVATYATVPYADVDPTVFAALAYIVMFGVMFADAGHGLLLVAAAVALRAGVGRRPGHRDRLAGLRRVWGYLAAAGLVATATGVAYGEFFGPTGALPFAGRRPPPGTAAAAGPRRRRRRGAARGRVWHRHRQPDTRGRLVTRALRPGRRRRRHALPRAGAGRRRSRDREGLVDGRRRGGRARRPAAHVHGPAGGGRPRWVRGGAGRRRAVRRRSSGWAPTSSPSPGSPPSA